MVRIPQYGISDAFGRGFGDIIYTITSVVAGCGSEVPSLDSVWRPRAANGAFFVHHNTDAGGRLRGAVEIKCPVDVGMGGQLRVQSGSAKKVQGQKRLGQEAVPEVQGEIRVG